MSELRRSLHFTDENNNKIYHLRTERKEQILCEEYLDESCVVLELGARYGTVSCVIEKTIKNPKNLIAVEPDDRVWEALERNRDENDCSFRIVKGFISKKPRKLADLDSWDGYGTTSKETNSSDIPSYTLKQIESKYKVKFNTLVADCEGFLEKFFDENPQFYDQLKIIIFEKDRPKECDYNKIKNVLKEKGFLQKVALFREAWVKNSSSGGGIYKRRMTRRLRRGVNV
jgi:FkbM family methyltransferase